MPFPLIPIAVVAVGGFILGSRSSADSETANVVVNTDSNQSSLQNNLLLGAAVVTAVVLVPRILPPRK